MQSQENGVEPGLVLTRYQKTALCIALRIAREELLGGIDEQLDDPENDKRARSLSRALDAIQEKLGGACR
jgi:hypothetical protein